MKATKLEQIKQAKNFEQHLYFENRINSREYAIDRCMKVLGMIARLKDRVEKTEIMCENLYGRNEEGVIMASNIEFKIHKRALEMIERLKKYYNFCVLRINMFELKNNI